MKAIIVTSYIVSVRPNLNIELNINIR